MISAEHPLFSVDGVLNGVLVRGNMVGDVMFFGSGAGKLPTASAVVADVVEAVRHLHDTVETIWDAKTLELAPMEEATNQFFVRVKNTEADKVAEIFGEVDKITVEQLPDEFAFVTKQMTEAQFADAAGALDGMLSRIRVSL
jgi:homoserine dehydrogenase